MDNTYFIYNQIKYHNGTIVEIYDQYTHYFKFNRILKFTGYNAKDNLYYFTSMHDTWAIYAMTAQQILLYIKEILEYPVVMQENKINPNYIENIMTAWIWYILIFILSLCAKGIGNVILGCVASTIIFFSWRHKKIKGG